MTTKQKAEMYAAIKRHGENLLALFPDAKIKSPVELCKALRRLELKAHKAAENWCNGVDCGLDGEKQYTAGQKLAAEAETILGMPVPAMEDTGVIFNGDPRGYALKIGYVDGPKADRGSLENTVEVYKDWGGYGIIAPDFTPNK